MRLQSTKRAGRKIQGIRGLSVWPWYQGKSHSRSSQGMYGTTEWSEAASVGLQRAGSFDTLTHSILLEKLAALRRRTWDSPSGRRTSLPMGLRRLD